MVLRILLIIVLTMFSTYSFASIYKCDINGVLSFSQFPCSEDAVEIIVKKSTTTYQADLNKDEFYSQTVISALKQLRNLLTQIQETKGQKNEYQKQLKNQINQLNN